MYVLIHLVLQIALNESYLQQGGYRTLQHIFTDHLYVGMQAQAK